MRRKQDFAEAMIEGIFEGVLEASMRDLRRDLRYVPRTIRYVPLISEQDLEDARRADAFDISDRPELEKKSCCDCRHRRMFECPVLHERRSYSDPACRHFR